MKRVIDRIAAVIPAARNNADGQTMPGQIILSREAYEALYYAALDAKRVLVALKDML